jgi:hypothetical protein
MDVLCADLVDGSIRLSLIRYGRKGYGFQACQDKELWVVSVRRTTRVNANSTYQRTGN